MNNFVQDIISKLLEMPGVADQLRKSLVNRDLSIIIDGKEYIIFVNSWGNGFGENGFGYIGKDYFEAGQIFNPWTLLDQKSQPQQPVSKVFSGLKIETDKTTGQRHLKLPIPKKEVFQGIANLLNEFSKKI